MPGRKGHHPKLKEIEGAFRKDPQRRKAKAVEGLNNPPEPSSIILSKPTLVTVWRHTCEMLDGMGILSSSDSHLIESYAIVYHEMLELSRSVLKDGHVDVGSHGSKQSTESAVWLKLLAQHKSLMAELGLTPTARAKIVVPKTEQQVDEVDALLGDLGDF